MKTLSVVVFGALLVVLGRADLLRAPEPPASPAGAVVPRVPPPALSPAELTA